MKHSPLRGLRSGRPLARLAPINVLVLVLVLLTSPISYAGTPNLIDPHAHHASLLAAQGTASALSFNGSNAYVQVADNAGLRIPIRLTAEAWIKPAAVSGHQHIVGKNNYELSVEPMGTGFKALFEFSVGGNWRSVASGQLALNQWYHVAGIYDGSNMRLFVNGTRVAGILTSGNIDQTANPLRIGSADASGDFFNGAIDEVRVSNIVRYTGNFVPAQAPFTTDTNTKGLWHFDEGSGTTTADASGNGNTGTLLNSPVWIADSPYTGPDVTPPVISAVTAANLTTTSAAITWTTNEPATSQVEYGITTAYGSTTTFDAALVTNHRQTLSGLAANTLYHYWVISKDGAANQTVSPDATFTTLANDPPAAPIISGVASGNITPSAATIIWATDLPADSQIEYGTTTAYGSSTPLDPTLTTSHSQTLSGLVANTTYHYRVKSRGQNGVLATSGDAVFATGNATASSIGQWSAALNWPLVAVHSALLPSGDVLVWDAWELAPNVSARVWNPASQTFTGVTNQFSSIFCSGHSSLIDGRLLVAGGFTQNEYGIKDTNIFNPQTNSWTRVADMRYPRWYPTTATLNDGRVIVFGGLSSPGVYADVPEVYNPATNQWTQLLNAQFNVGEYPNTYVLPNGKVFLLAGPDYKSRTLDVGAQSWSLVGDAPLATGSSVMYRPGKVMAAGGGTPNVDPVQRGTAVIDLTASAPSWRQTASMAFPRFQHNLVTLPDGNVLAVGGSTQYSLVSTQGVRQAELWNPSTETWTTMASMRDLRMYHSTALLLPDGRVLVAGGGRTAPAVDYLTAEIYSPPYLFNGARPTITSAPTRADYAASFSIQTPDAANISAVSLVRLPSVTHTVNTDQRYVPINFTRTSTGLNAQAPANANTAPPGYYMLFVVNSNGVPSVAKIVQLGGTAQPDQQAPSVALSAPANGATVSGTAVQIAATASDNVGVAAVDLLLDGAPLGSSLTSAPYTFAWNTTTAGNGSHTIGARARDAAGNVASATDVQVTVANTSSDTQPPVISAVVASAIQGSTATITWTTNEPATSQVEYGTTTSYGSTTVLDSTRSTSHSQALSSLSTTTTYHYRVRSTDAAGNTAVSNDATFATTGAVPVTLLGETTVKTNEDYNPAGMAEAFQYTATTTGNVNKLMMYVDVGTSAQQVVIGLYSNTRDDNPGTLLTQATITNPVKGAWNSVAVPPATLTGGAKYWIAELTPLGDGIVRFRDVASGGKAQTSVQSNLSVLPATWSAGATYFNSPMSAYAVQEP